MEELWGISTPRHPKRLNIAPQINGLIIADYLFNKKLPLKEQSLSTTVMRILELKKHQEHKWESGLNIDCPHSLYYLFLRKFHGQAKLERWGDSSLLQPRYHYCQQGSQNGYFQGQNPDEIHLWISGEGQCRLCLGDSWELLTCLSKVRTKSAWH